MRRSQEKAYNICAGGGWKHKYENYILALLTVVVNGIVMGICFDFYYDLNDDTMMLDIMSGAYSGGPDGHNMQTLYPLGALIALCYRICGAIPWYGLFLCLCQFGCFYLIAVRLCALQEERRILNAGEASGIFGVISKAALLFSLSLFVWGLCLTHLVNIQYTVTSAILSASAVFLFLTTPDPKDSRQFVIRNVPAMVLVVTAWQLRSEMLLLTVPFICLAGLYRLAESRKIFEKENLIRYGSVLGIMLAGMLVSGGIDCAAYGDAAWKDFRQLFAARTTVYDFYPQLVMEDSCQDALTGLGVTAGQQKLLRNYNYGLDDTIDSRFLMKLADYASDTMRAGKDWGSIAREQIYRYYDRTLRGGDGIYSALLLWMYAAALLTGLIVRPGFRKFDPVWQLLLLGIVRSAVWMFIMLRERDPERITHSLYLVEFALLSAMTVRIVYRSRGEKAVTQTQGGRRAASCEGRMTVRLCRCIVWIMAVMFFLLTGEGVLRGVPALRADQEKRARINEEWYAIDEYCRAHSENYYLEDVYSTVSFSRRIFDDAGRGYANYDILGGWMCGSPLYYDKLRRQGIETVHEALLDQDHAYLIMSDGQAAEEGFAWISDFYNEKGIAVTVEKTDRIGREYAVYQIRR